MIEPTSYQRRGEFANSDDYDRLFIPRVHRLIKLGYDRLNPHQYAHAQETTITGDLIEAINDVLDRRGSGRKPIEIYHTLLMFA